MLTREQALQNLGADEIEHRQKAEETYQAFCAAEAAFEAVRPKSQGEREDAIRDEYAPRLEEAVRALKEERDAKINAVYECNEPDLPPSNLEDLKMARDATRRTWFEFDSNGDIRTHGDDAEIVRCALTGVAVFDGDDVVTIGDKAILVAALGLDPDLVPPSSEPEDDEAEEAC